MPLPHARKDVNMLSSGFVKIEGVLFEKTMEVGEVGTISAL